MSVFLLLLLVSEACVGLGQAVDLEREVELLKQQNAILVSRLEALKKGLSGHENTGSSSRLQRQSTYEGPHAFTYRLDTKAMNVHNTGAIRFPVKVTDLGGGYDNTTGIYTAPRDGLYLISCSMLADEENHSNPRVHASIMVDGNTVAKVLAFSEHGNHRDQGANTVFVNIKAGSRVWVRAVDSALSTIGGDMYSTFSGYLLWAM